MDQRDWIEFFAAFVTFFISHSLPLRPTIRAGLTEILGRANFLVAYSGVSLVTLYWLMSAAGRAPYLELWSYASWQNYVPIIAMVASTACLAFSLFRPNPFSFGGTNNDQFLPSHPDIVRWFRHPLLVALFIWAIAHLVPNGNLAHVLVFGSFALFSLLGMYLIDARRRRELGNRWSNLTQELRESPILPRPTSKPLALFRAISGVLAYVTLSTLHPQLTGVQPWP